MGGGMGQGQGGGRVPSGQTPTQGPFVNTPVDVPSLIASKGYNPVNFDLRPGFVSFFLSSLPFILSLFILFPLFIKILMINNAPTQARYFVIKSYTEDDVHKSLKYEIWSSTEPGNKRLDKAFKECGGRGPIYLFFSVNARCVCFSFLVLSRSFEVHVHAQFIFFIFFVSYFFYFFFGLLEKTTDN
jgi:hypothetical protein